MKDKTYVFDVRINCTIEVKAQSLVSAKGRANEILDHLELVDHLRDGTIDMDLEDGLELLEILT